MYVITVTHFGTLYSFILVLPDKIKRFPVASNPVDETLTVSKFLEIY